MAYTRGKFGIYYNPEKTSGETHFLRWGLAALVIILSISYAGLRGCSVEQSAPKSEFAGQAPIGGNIVREIGSDEPKVRGNRQKFFGLGGGSSSSDVAALPQNGPAFDPVQATKTERIVRNGKKRSPNVLALLERRTDAAGKGDIRMEIDAIERLRNNYRDEIADIDDALARRLGNLNRRWLFDGDSPLAIQVTLERGKTLFQLAREHGTTVAAVMRLNSIVDAAKLSANTKLRVLEHPKAKLRIYVASGIADLEIKGKFFRRYSVKVPKSIKSDTITITREKFGGPRSVFAKMGITFDPAPELEEVAMLLAPDSMIVLSNP